MTVAAATSARCRANAGHRTGHDARLPVHNTGRDAHPVRSGRVCCGAHPVSSGTHVVPPLATEEES